MPTVACNFGGGACLPPSSFPAVLAVMRQHIRQILRSGAGTIYLGFMFAAGGDRDRLPLPFQPFGGRGGRGGRGSGGMFGGTHFY